MTRNPFFWALKFQSSYQKVVPFCHAAKILITKGYDVEMLTIHINIHDLHVKTKECANVSTSTTMVFAPVSRKNWDHFLAGCLKLQGLKKRGFASFPTLKTRQFEIINGKTFQKWNKNFHFIGTLIRQVVP